jgi:hypothetical protein
MPSERDAALTSSIITTKQERYPALIPAVITAMHTIELIGSYVARHVESGLTVDLSSHRNRSTTKGPLSPLCRKLLDLGHDPGGKVHVIRKALDRAGHIPVFKRDRTLKTWADVDCVESETRSLHVQKYRPYPDAVGLSEALDLRWGLGSRGMTKRFPGEAGDPALASCQAFTSPGPEFFRDPSVCFARLAAYRCLCEEPFPRYLWRNGSRLCQ